MTFKIKKKKHFSNWGWNHKNRRPGFFKTPWYKRNDVGSIRRHLQLYEPRIDQRNGSHIMGKSRHLVTFLPYKSHKHVYISLTPAINTYKGIGVCFLRASRAQEAFWWCFGGRSERQDKRLRKSWTSRMWTVSNYKNPTSKVKRLSFSYYLNKNLQDLIFIN